MRVRSPVVLMGDKGVSFEVTVRNWGPVLEVVMQLNSWGAGGVGCFKNPKDKRAHTRTGSGNSLLCPARRGLTAVRLR